MIFSGLRFPHKGFWNTILEAKKISTQEVVIVYPRNPNPDSNNPFSDQQRIAMFKEYAKENKLNNIVLVGISKQEWEDLQSKELGSSTLQSLTKSLGKTPKDFLYLRGPVEQSRNHQIYTTIEEQQGLQLHIAAKLSTFRRADDADPKPVNTDDILRNFNDSDKKTREMARSALPEEILQIIRNIGKIAREQKIPFSKVDARKISTKDSGDLGEDGAIEFSSPNANQEKADDSKKPLITRVNPEKKRPKSIGFFLGRFQAFHKGHQSVVERSLEKNELTVVIISSSPDSSAKTPHSFEQVKHFIETVFANQISSGKLVVIDRDQDLGNSNDPKNWQALTKKFNLDEKGIATIYAGNKAADLTPSDNQHYIAQVAARSGLSLVLVPPQKFSSANSSDKLSKELDGTDASAFHITTNPTSPMAMQLMDQKILHLIYRYWACTYIMINESDSKISCIRDVTKKDLEDYATKIDSLIEQLNAKGLALRPDIDGREVNVFNKQNGLTDFSFKISLEGVASNPEASQLQQQQTRGNNL